MAGEREQAQQVEQEVGANSYCDGARSSRCSGW